MRKKKNSAPPMVPEEKEFYELAKKISNNRAKRLSGHYGFLKSDIPDIEQDLLLEVYRKRKSFDPDKGSEATFIFQIINNKAAKMIEHRQTDRRDWRLCRQSLNEVVNIPDAEPMELVDLICVDDNKNFELGVDLNIVLERLPVELRELCDQLLKYDAYQIPRATSQPRGKVRYNLQKLREIIWNYGISEKFR